MYENIPRSQRRDPIRPGKRLRCKVDVWSARTSIPGQSTPQAHGPGEVIIHEDDLEALEGKVEVDRPAWGTAVGIYRRKLAEAIVKALGDPKVTDDLVLAMPRGDWPPAWAKLEDGFTSSSPSGEFRNLTGHDHTALLSVEVVEELPGEIGRDMQLAAQVAQAMHPSVNGGGGDAALRAEVAELRAELLELRKLAAPVNAKAESKTTKKS